MLAIELRCKFIHFPSILRSPFSWTIWSKTLHIGSSCLLSTPRDALNRPLSTISTSRVSLSTQVRYVHLGSSCWHFLCMSVGGKTKRHSNQYCCGSSSSSYRTGATLNQVEIELSPLLAGLAVTAATLFVFVCCVLVALYRRQRNANK